MKSVNMKRYLIIVIAALSAACAGSTKEQGVVEKNDAIEDYVIVAQLPSIDSIRTRQQFHHQAITDKYIILADNRNSYLAVFDRRCRELDDVEVTPDYRHDANRIRARFDTYRGCRISHLYDMTDGQAQELLDLGKKLNK
jgi:hypothetical protein